ncbi:MAG: S-layer homology domain-containing protein [Paenibacillus sp.]|uniref:S-layer homology domain-containing protein n=1 Tax=Paenibacillus sp. TaxID=58172 RepID=UPI002913C9DC|nr:S-layer homology domain-containing protein [Paenibacillus sp.]MDU4697741.1 S-layer homology domain-containing protein [Paenibacillus sp.]
MQRFKKPFLWLTLLSLVITLAIPMGSVPVAKAADSDLSSTTYFSPDILDIRKTISLVTEYTASDHNTTTPVDPKNWKQINRDNVYKTSRPTLDIKGTFSQVNSTNMTVKVEQLVSSANASGQVSWVPDSTRYNYGVVGVDPEDSSGKRFVAKSLSLFPGFNKITFTGLQGELQRSESFYVLYDKVPYLNSLKLMGGGTSGVALNEGTPVVVKDSVVSLQGVAMNATRLSVSANGGRAQSTYVDSVTGNFNTPGLILNPGLNTLQLKLENGSDSVNIERTVYYYKQTDIITGLYVYDGAQGYDILNKVPSITTGGITSVRIVGQILVPFSTSTDDFETGAKLYVNDSTTASTFEIRPINPFAADGTLSGDSGTEVIIPGSNGMPEYRLVTFEITDSGITPVNGTNQVKLRVEYGTGTSMVNFTTSQQFKYLPNQSLITNLYLLSNYTPGDNVTKISKEPLNGAQVNTGSFYILVESSNTPTSGDLEGSFLPVGYKVMDLDHVAGPGAVATPDTTTGLTNKQEVYKISNFPSGQQQVRFSYGDDYKDVTVSYVSMNNIYVENLIDGQTYSFNSKVTNQLSIKGSYIGFESIDTAEYFINGISGTSLKDGPDSDGDATNGNDNGTKFDFNIKSKRDFELVLNIKPSGPLVYGENLIRFTGSYKDAMGNVVERVKELRIYIIDENGSTIDKFIPSVAATDRPDLPSQALYQKISFEVPTTTETETFNATMSSVLALSPRFVYDNSQGNYTTTQEQYDLVVRGGGAEYVNLYFGSQRIISEKLPTGAAGLIANKPFTLNGKTYIYNLVGSDKDFVLRVEGLQFEAPGSHVYNLELVNSTGARTTKKLEVTRVVENYRLLSPQPTVGDQYIVNKNFVRFDIEAEGATKVIIGKEEATPIQLDGKTDRFIYDYVGLKPDKATKIKIDIVRADTTFSDTIEVYYTSTVDVNAQFMAEKVADKYTVLNKNVQLSFPKGTILQTANPGADVTQYYPNSKLLFGIADPEDGVVERRDDYGNYVGRVPTNVDSPLDPIGIDTTLKAQFNSPTNTSNFTRVSDIYWISGGLGEYRQGNTYYPASNGVAPHSIEGSFPDYMGRSGAGVVPAKSRKIVPSKRGSLTLKYDENVVDEAGTTITVFRYTGEATSAGVWENIGGEVNTKNHTITVPFDDFGYYKVMKLRRSYEDITNHNWARNILNALYSKGIMPSLRTDAFGSDDQTTRGEFATLLVKGLNLPLNYDINEQTFFDISYPTSSTTWSFESIETAARAGIVTGQTEGFFNPDLPITREQAAVMIARALKLKLSANDSKLNANLAKSFVDSGSMDYYARPAIEAVTKAKIMSGSPSTLPGQKKPVYNFNPDGYLTRAEAGKIAVELLKKSTSIFPKNLS